MSRRYRNQDPLQIRRIVESERRAGLDLAWIVVVGVLLCAAAIYWSVPDALLERLDSLDRWNMNGILALAVVLPLGAAAFALRRYRDAVAAQRELTRMSVHDTLTGLPSRRHLREVLPDVLQHARHHNVRSAVLFVDLDGLNAVNDPYGHEVGDDLMTAVAARLRSELGEERFVSRYAGDEFVIVDPAPQTVENGSRLAREVVRLIEVPFDLGEDRIGISASVGIAFGDSTNDPKTLVRDAETAMYEAKTSPDRTAAFGPAMRNRMTPANAEWRKRSSAASSGSSSNRSWAYEMPDPSASRHFCDGLTHSADFCAQPTSFPRWRTRG